MRRPSPRAKLSRRALRWALEAIVVQHLTITRVAEALAVSWNTANDAVLAEGRRVLINDPQRLDGVKVIGVDEHCWRHTRRGDNYVTVIIDLTPVRDGTGPARLLDMVEGRSKQVFKTWLDAQSPAFRDGIEVVAMDGFTGFKTAAAEVVPDAVAVMDPFHVVALAGDALDRCRQRVQQETRGHRGRTGDPLYGIRRALRTGADLLTERQRRAIRAVFADERHVEVEATWGIYQRIVAAYRHTDRIAAKTQLRRVIDSISRASRRSWPSWSPSAAPCIDAPPTCSPTSTDPAHQRPDRGHQRTPGTPPRLRARLPQPHQLHRADHCSRPAASDPNYTLDSDEPEPVIRVGGSSQFVRGGSDLPC